MEKEHAKAKPWLKTFSVIKQDAEMKHSLEQIREKIDAEFEQVNLEEWK
jgi:hypothetical protein